MVLLALGLFGCQSHSVAQTQAAPPTFDPSDPQIRSQNCHDGQAEFTPVGGLNISYGPKSVVHLYAAGQSVPLAPGEKDIPVPSGKVALLVIPPKGYLVGLLAGYPDVGLANIHGSDALTGRSLILYPGELKSATICLISIEYAKQFGYRPVESPAPGAKA